MKKTAMTLGGLALLAGTTIAIPPANAEPKPVARVWLTTGDERNLLADRTDLLQPADPAAPTITVNPRETYQKINGFGASLTDSSAHLIFTSPDKQEIMRSLFSPSGRGLGLSYLRQPIGSSDFVNGPHYTYDDMPAGQTDLGLKHFSIAHDRKEILPLLRLAKAINPGLRIIGTPWSPPAWMKTNDSLIGGRLKPDAVDVYADYLVKYVKAYKVEGVKVDALTVQNEPQNRNPDGYPGMDLRPDEAAAVIKALGPKLRAAGLDTQILGYDHNWSLHPNDSGPAEDPADPEYVKTLMSDAQAAKEIDGLAFHCYAGDPDRMSAAHDAYPSKDILLTECSGSRSANPATTFADTLHWQTRQLTVWGTRHWASTVISWNLALDPAGGPRNGGCATCFGVVTIDPATGKATPTAEYYVLGHASKFIKRGAVRLGTSFYAGSVIGVTFRNPDGSIYLLAVNDDWGSGSQRFNVSMGRTNFSYELPSGGVATFRLR
ncbi:glycoside hydrolase family 30 protein [Nonomuraea sp. 3N208]|uniref:glycoside hydrolase family 30 protein n=1 Tax=Nonomuraea sp. 3N208 TaxID=3457421 RepID=UPI003FCC3F09